MRASGWASRSNSLRRHRGGSRSPSRPRFETLEDRILLSIGPNPFEGTEALSSISVARQDRLPAREIQLEAGQTLDERDRPISATEIVAAIRSDRPLETLTNELRGAVADAFDAAHSRLIDLPTSRTMFTLAETAIVQVGLAAGVSPLSAIAALKELPSVEWAAPNYVYTSEYLGYDPREFTPNDPFYSVQYHHPLMQNDLAWDTTLGNPSLIIAVTDDGVELTHSDLSANIWVNSGEIPGNGIDDDGNGYIDDRNGWDFSSNDNDPNPPSSDQSHGTHVAGIAAGRTNNSIGISGTAGGSTIMPIRFYGSGAWTSTVVANSYAYAADNGAKIVNTSYNVDGFVGDPTFEAALNYLYGQGVLHFNSAGNNNQPNPLRQVYDQSLYVASTDNADLKSGFSNYGWGIDVAAPGSGIASTITGNAYAYSSGTSMATPNAAGAAALIWSAHPTWTRDQVAAQLLGTADNIDGLNPAYAGLLGTGRVNSYRGVTQTLAAPKLRGLVGIPEEGTSPRTTTLSLEVANVLDATTANDIANYELRSNGPDNLFDTADDVVIPLTLATNYRIGTNRIKFTIPSLEPEAYRFRAISGGLTDPFGTALDGDSDGTAGGDFVHTFTVLPGTYQAEAFAFEPIDLEPGQPGVFTILDNADIATQVIDLGSNSFNFYGRSYAGPSLHVSTKGLITFGSGYADYGNTDLTVSPDQATIAPLWDDWITFFDDADSVLGRFDDLDSDGVPDQLLIEWSRVPHYDLSWSESATFQAILQLNTGSAWGDIVFNYVDLSVGHPAYDEGASATVGIKAEGEQGTSRLLISENTASPLVGSGKAIRIGSASSYHASSTPFEALDLIAGQPGVLTILDGVDDETAPIDLGANTFTFYGITYTGAQLFASTNGLLSFGSGNDDYTNTNLTFSPLQAVIAPLWDDWITFQNAADAVLARFDDLNGDAIPDRLVVEWSQTPHYNSLRTDPVTFQAILQLNTGLAWGDIIFNYPDLDVGEPSINEGISATVGIKADDEQGGDRLLLSHRSAFPLVGTGRAIQIRSTMSYRTSATDFEPIDLVAGEPGVITVLDGLDDASAAIDLGTNTFRFYGVTYTGASLFASTNGLLTFGSGHDNFTNTDLSLDPLQAAIAPFWDDWRTDTGPADMVLAKFEDLNGDTIPDLLIVEWSAVPHFSVSPSPVTFQAILQLNTGSAWGDIVFNYPDLNAGDVAWDEGASATVGIKREGADSVGNVVVSFDSLNDLVGTGKAIRLSTNVVLGPSTVIDDGDAGFETVGTWLSSGLGGFQGDSLFNTSNSENQIATWTFPVAPGQAYRVYVTYPAHPSSSTSAPFTILDGAIVLGAEGINQRVAPDDLSADGAWWEQVAGDVLVSSSSLVVRLSGNGVNGSVRADAVRIEPAPLPPPTSVIDDGDPGFTTVGTWLASNLGGYQGDSLFNTSNSESQTASWTFLVTPGQTYRAYVTYPAHSSSSTAAAFTILDGTIVVGVEGINQRLAPDDLSADGVWWEQVAGDLTPTGSVLVVRLLGNGVNGSVRADAVRIEPAPPPPPPAVIDDGDAGFTTVGTWLASSLGGFQGDSLFNTSNSASQTASWTFPVIPGQAYRVYTTYPAHPSSSTAAPFAILDGAIVVGSETINQRVAPDDLSADGAWWEQIAGTIVAIGSTLTVRLSGNGVNGSVRADAIRLEPAPPPPPPAVIDDGDAGFTTVGTWLASSLGGFQGDSLFNTSNSASQTASWTFTVTPGQTYRIYATYPSHPSSSTLAPFAILDGTTVVGAEGINQRLAPDDLLADGVWWEQVAGNITTAGAVLVVRLSGNGLDGSVRADAVRIELVNAGEAVHESVAQAGTRAFIPPVTPMPVDKPEATRDLLLSGLLNHTILDPASVDRVLRDLGPLKPLSSSTRTPDVVLMAAIASRENTGSSLGLAGLIRRRTRLTR